MILSVARVPNTVRRSLQFFRNARRVESNANEELMVAAVPAWRAAEGALQPQAAAAIEINPTSGAQLVAAAAEPSNTVTDTIGGH